MPSYFVVGDESLSAEDVMSFVAERVSPHKKVRRVEFVDQIPKAASGKILRRVLIDQETARASAEAEAGPAENEVAT